MDAKKEVARLQELVGCLVDDGVKSTKEFTAWKKEHEQWLVGLFGYERLPGMPAVSTLVNAAFHPELPLISFNYTPVAHNTLHLFPTGWTPVLRLCRGIVFDQVGNLVALPFPKFFNYGEMEETREIQSHWPFEATAKMDGHLGIIFYYEGQFVLTTRGYFDSPTAILGNKMLAQYVKENNWKENFPDEASVLVEVIHPETKVYTDYGDRKEFVLIGGYDLVDMTDFNHHWLSSAGSALGLPVVEMWPGQSLEDLIKLMKDRSATNQEGFVARFPHGLRVKFKFETYIGLMVQDRLSYAYLMNRAASGNLKKMLDTLPEEIYDIALRMLGDVMLLMATPGSQKDKWQALYGLHDNGVSESHFRDICRKFVRSMTKAPLILE